MAGIKNVAIIGAGPGGVAAAKYLLAENHFENIDIFEQQVSFGGVWNYSKNIINTSSIPQTDPHQGLDEPVWHFDPSINLSRPVFVTPMYERLETNIPHCLMRYTDDTSLENNQLFPDRQAVVRYLHQYAEDVKNLVHFQHQVTDVHRTDDDAQRRWLVHIKDLQSGLSSEGFYDAILVATGHYTVPSLPAIEGIETWNRANNGLISHSKFYRSPDSFTNKKVVIVGNSASGIDIASQIATVSKHPILISQRSESLFEYEAGYKKNLPEIVEFLPPSQAVRAVRFANGQVETDIDAVLFCTGYYFSFPFLTTLESKLISTGERVKHTYMHTFYIDDPTLAFVGLPFKIIPFRTFEGQAAVISRIWSGRLSLPSVIEMRKWEERRISERGSGKLFHTFRLLEDFDYHDSMIDWAMQVKDGDPGRLPPKWSQKERWLRERFPAIKNSFAERGEGRSEITAVEELGFDYDEWLNKQ